jgi:hypothetical protein
MTAKHLQRTDAPGSGTDPLPMLLAGVSGRTSFRRWCARLFSINATVAPETPHANPSLPSRPLLREIAKLSLLSLLALALALAFSITRNPRHDGVGYPGVYDTRALP